MAEEEIRRLLAAAAGNEEDDPMNLDADQEEEEENGAGGNPDGNGGVGGDAAAAAGAGAANQPGRRIAHRPRRHHHRRVVFNPPAAYQQMFDNLANMAFRFVRQYQVMSPRLLESGGRTNLESGGKIILPPDALDVLTRSSSNLARPMLFQATSLTTNKFTHCGVLEFVAEPATCYMPDWMMAHLGVANHERIQIERVDLPTATFCKFQPQSTDFLEISDPRAVLENTLRSFACLTKGDMITIGYNDRKYKLLVLEARPRDAVTIIDCDMNVDFAPPVGYVEPKVPSKRVEEEDEEEEMEDDHENGGGGGGVFSGVGNRLDGGSVDKHRGGGSRFLGGKGGNGGGGDRRVMADTDWQIGNLQFQRKFKSGKRAGAGGGDEKGSQQQAKFAAFGGKGLSLRGKNEQ